MPEMVLAPLERAYAVPQSLPGDIAGIVLIGGTQRIDAVESYGNSEISALPDVMTFMRMARQYPHARLLFSGGSGELVRGNVSEADVIKQTSIELGIDPRRLILEASSRDTYENALYGKQAAQPKPGEKWILITSAVHMPRTLGVFAKVGWPVIPYPAGHLTPRTGFAYAPYVLEQFKKLDMAVHEWIGIAVYKMTDRMQ